jgi:hypothetical protein
LIGRFRFGKLTFCIASPFAVSAPMNDLFEIAWTFVREHWSKIVSILFSALFGWWFGKRRARKRWREREFLDRINFSLTTVRDGKLLIRTLLEKRCEDVFLNAVAAETVVAKAQETTASQSLLPLPQDDYWFYLNAALNELSEQFAAGSLRRDLGQPVTCGRYLICLTSEAAGTSRTRKIRCLVMQKSLLTNLPPTIPVLEAASHNTRWATLQQLATAYGESPQRFLELELCV